MISIHPLEGLWLAINGTTLLITVLALREARGDRDAVQALNGLARELAADAIVRRETARLVVQLLLIGLAVPGIFVDRDVSLTPFVAILLTVAVVIAGSSLLDARDRKRLTAALRAEAERTHKPT